MAIGTPSSDMTESGPATFAALLGELQQRGYVEGTSIVYERWSAAGLPDTELGKLAQRVVETRPDLIFVDGSRLVLAVKNATASIPVVFTALAIRDRYPRWNYEVIALQAALEVLPDGAKVAAIMPAGLFQG